jgi:hypothetical protein
LHYDSLTLRREESVSEFNEFQESDPIFRPSSGETGRPSLGERRPELAAAVVYLRSRRIEVPEDESPDDVMHLLDAVHAFERAVNERGGVVLIAGVGQPRSSGKRFLMPARRDDETIGAFAERISLLSRRLGGAD